MTTPPPLSATASAAANTVVTAWTVAIRTLIVDLRLEDCGRQADRKVRSDSMASSTLVESVLGIPLFVPDAYDQFSIVAAGMPNGDDSLRIRGDLSSDYKAFQPQPATTPDIGNDGTSWTMVLWIKAPNNAGSAPIYGDCIVSMMRASKSGTGEDNRALWSLYATSTLGQVGFNRSLSAGGGNFDCQMSLSGARDGTWHMVTVYAPDSGQSGQMFLDDALTAGGSDNQPVPGTAADDMFLSIGAYSVEGSVDGFAQDYEIGKLSFHDGHLTETQRLMLYDAMVN